MRYSRVLLSMLCFCSVVATARAESIPTVEDVIVEWDRYVEWASVLEGVVRFEGKTASPGGAEQVTRILSKVYLDSPNNRMIIEATPEEGDAWVDGMNEDYNFSLLRKDVEKDWSLEGVSLPPRQQSLVGALHTTCQGFVLINKLLPEMLASKTIEIKALRSTEAEGRKLLLLEFEDDSPKNGWAVSSAELYLDGEPPYLPLEATGRFVGPTGLVSAHIVNSYDYEALAKPVIKKQRLDVQYPSPSGGEVERLEVRYIELARLSRTAAVDYRLPAFGIDEPSQLGVGNTRFVWIAINAAVLLLALGVWFKRQVWGPSSANAR